MTTKSRRRMFFGAVLISLALMAVFLFQAIQGARTRAMMDATMNNGVNIYKAVFSAAVDAEVTGAPPPWPMTTGDTASATSTDYFRRLAAAKVLPADFSLFAGPGLEPCTNADPMAFHAENNAWCVVAQTDGHRTVDSTPFMFTRNLEISVSGGKVIMKLTDKPPFGEKWVVIVTRSGAGFVLKSTGLQSYAQKLDPAFVGTIMRP